MAALLGLPDADEPRIMSESPPSVELRTGLGLAVRLSGERVC